MNIEEIIGKYKKSIKDAQDIYIAEFKQFLEENNLDGIVVRIKDGKIGRLSINDDLSIGFYPMKKNGERAPFRCGCDYKNILNDFKPFD